MQIQSDGNATMQRGKGREGIVSWMKGKGTGGIGRLGEGTGHSDSKEKGKEEEEKTKKTDSSSSSSITTTKVQTHEKRGEETRDSKRARPEAR